jgi:prolyl oligopeptidase
MNRLSIFILILLPFSISAQETDPFIWLEEVDSPKALEWVKQQDTFTVRELTNHPEFQSIYHQNLEIYNSDQRIATPEQIGKYIYNFWRDDRHQRGIWRRTTTDEYLKTSPGWETVLDIDSLSEAENIPWSFKWTELLYPEYNKCLLYLSRGGSDATVVKEFDLEVKKFVEDGFKLPEAKSGISWIDENTVFVITDFGPGSVTNAGYGRIVKIWKRGTPLNEAKTIYEGNVNDMSAFCFADHKPGRSYYFILRSKTIFTSELFALENGEIVKLNVPEDIELKEIFNNQCLFQLKSDWNPSGTFFTLGSLISIDYDELLKEGKDFTLVYKPAERECIKEISCTKNFILMNSLNNVQSELSKVYFKDKKWIREKINVPEYGNITVISAENESDNFFFSFENFLSPTTVFYHQNDGNIDKVKSLPEFFDASELEVTQHLAVSTNGTEIPYFMVHNKKLKHEGNNPTLLYGYGGFEVPVLPVYNSALGSAWLQRGGIYVLANIRGGGEFGPGWHLCAVKENRQKAYDDLIAVSENLIRNKITSQRHLGISGASNGGLLAGVMLTQRPDLFNAVVCERPLLDMQRYNKLLAGASWVAEYGNPDIPEEWEYIKKYSPYQNLDKNKNYPRPLFMTSIRDDRVHPGHARKMAALMMSFGKSVYFYENTEGGHGGTGTNKQAAFENALKYTYLWKMLN